MTEALIVEEYHFSGRISGLAHKRALFATCFVGLCKGRDPQLVLLAM